MPPQEREPLAQQVAVGRPAQQPEPFPPQPLQQRAPYENGVGVGEGPRRELHRPEPLDAPGHHVTVGPVHLVPPRQQRPCREPRGVLVDDRTELHARVPLPHRAVRARGPRAPPPPHPGAPPHHPPRSPHPAPH
ncbi:hypothetical protein ACFXA8_27755, partial [Streptomyces sp. NPDC059409]